MNADFLKDKPESFEVFGPVIQGLVDQWTIFGAKWNTKRGRYGNAIHYGGDVDVEALKGRLERQAVKMNRRHGSSAGFLWQRYERAAGKLRQQEAVISGLNGELASIKKHWWYRLFAPKPKRDPWDED